MHYFDAYPQQSRLRLVHPAVKMGLFVVYTALALASQSVVVSIALLAVVALGTVYTARIGLLRLLRLMMIPASFVLLGSFSVMMEINPSGAWLQIPFFGAVLGISPTGFHNGMLLMARSFSAISVLFALVLNTSITDMLFVFRKLKVPEVLLDIMVLVYRNIFVFSDAANDIYISQKSRLGYRNLQTSLRSTAQLGGRMFVLANCRAEHLYQSMASRCYNGKIDTLPALWQPNYTFLGVALMAAIVFALALCKPIFY
jgi:cobalt/nickel transport system permease protein